MKPVRVVTVGRPPRGAWGELVGDYAGRIARRIPFRLEAVPQDGSRRPGDRRRREARALLSCRPASGILVALDRGGRPLPTEKWPEALERWRSRGEVLFVVGGPDGLDGSLLEAADEVLSLGPLVLPHDLALLVLLEQVYRALAAAENHPYGRH